MKKILVLIVAVAFIFSVTSFCLAESWTGNITDIRGDKITIKDDKGKLRTVNKSYGCSGCAGMDLKVGNKVSVENGKIIGPSTPGALQKTKTPGNKGSEKSMDTIGPLQLKDGPGGSAKSSGELQKTKTPGSKAGIRSDDEEPLQTKPGGSAKSRSAGSAR
jgi:hypothetical protein